MFQHLTVLKEESVNGLNIRPDGIYVDCTMGGAGHSSAIAAQLNEDGVLIAFDQDELAIEHGSKLLSSFRCQVHIVKSNFRYLAAELEQLPIEWRNGVPKVDGILFDLGVSSPQLDIAERGFSYHQDAPLDMRMDQSIDFTAKQLVNEWPEDQISQILFKYGEEKFAKRIASNLVHARKRKSIETTEELSELIKEAIPAAARRSGAHPAKKSFQAIRIAVNDELGAFKEALEQSISLLDTKGRLCVITFHSLEDRICKQTIASYMKKCTCPPGLPICACGQTAEIKWISRKPVIPGELELSENRRARSSKLRIAEKIN